MTVLEALLALIAAGLSAITGLWVGDKLGDLSEKWHHKK